MNYTNFVPNFASICMHFIPFICHKFYKEVLHLTFFLKILQFFTLFFDFYNIQYNSMNYVKKICLLKEVHAGFATTGKSVSAMVTIESFRGKLSIAVNMIDFAPLTTGNYYVVLQNLSGQTEKVVLSHQKGDEIEVYSNFSIAEDFACVIASVATTVIPIAFGKCSDKTFQLTSLLDILQEEVTTTTSIPSPFEEDVISYDDEVVATENYYEKAMQEEFENVTTQDSETEEVDTREVASDEDVTSLFNIAAESVTRQNERSSYYFKVKDELDKLFAQYPKEEMLCKILPNAHFVKIEIATGRHYVVGIIQENEEVKYICYGLPTGNKTDLPPPALRGRVSFIPLSLFDLQGAGYWMLFQSANDGSCLTIQHS